MTIILIIGIIANIIAVRYILTLFINEWRTNKWVWLALPLSAFSAALCWGIL
jgi:Cu/Ag efflux pump CusA